MTQGIRPELADDAPAIRALQLAAFAPSRLEADIVDGLRADGDLVRSLVAVQDGELAGHVAISRAQVAPPDGAPVEVLALGPIGVLPERQGRGLGSALMRATLAAAAATPWPLIALLGHAEYYPRFGFEPAGALGLDCPYPAAPEHWMAYRLPAYDAALRGAFRYAPAFDRAT
ncbi:MAG: GNAT family N-acetyltransferase [Solirubrobacteraceae bacterium]